MAGELAAEAERQRLRAEVEQQVRDEFLNEDERAQELDRAKRALAIFYLCAGLAGLGIAFPLLGALLGLGVRLFLWLGGFRTLF